MAYVYRNVKTKETITTNNKVRGKNWEEVKKTDPKKTDPKKGAEDK